MKVVDTHFKATSTLTHAAAATPQHFKFTELCADLQKHVLSFLGSEEDFMHAAIALECNPTGFSACLSAFRVRFPHHPYALRPPTAPGDQSAEKMRRESALGAYLTAHPKRLVPNLPVDVSHAAHSTHACAFEHGWTVQEAQVRSDPNPPAGLSWSPPAKMCVTDLSAVTGLHAGEHLQVHEIAGTSPFKPHVRRAEDLRTRLHLLSAVNVFPKHRTALALDATNGIVGRIGWVEHAPGRFQPQWVPWNLGQLVNGMGISHVFTILDHDRGRALFVSAGHGWEIPARLHLIQIPSDVLAPIGCVTINNPHQLPLHSHFSSAHISPNREWLLMSHCIGQANYSHRVLLHPCDDQPPTWIPITAEPRLGRLLYLPWKQEEFLQHGTTGSLVNVWNCPYWLDVDVAAGTATLRALSDDAHAMGPGTRIAASGSPSQNAALIWRNATKDTATKFWHLSFLPQRGERQIQSVFDVDVLGKTLSALKREVQSFSVDVGIAPNGQWGVVSFPGGLGYIRDAVSPAASCDLVVQWPVQIPKHPSVPSLDVKRAFAPNGTWAIAMYHDVLRSEKSAAHRFFLIHPDWTFSGEQGRRGPHMFAVRDVVGQTDFTMPSTPGPIITMDAASRYAVVTHDSGQPTWVVYPTGQSYQVKNHAYAVSDSVATTTVRPYSKIIPNPHGAAKAFFQHDTDRQLCFLDLSTAHAPVWRSLEESASTLQQSPDAVNPVVANTTLTPLPSGELIATQQIYRKGGRDDVVGEVRFQPIKWRSQS